MPRRYHRPPASRRRKGKKTSIPYVFEGAPEPEDGGQPLSAEGEAGEPDSFEMPVTVERPSSPKRSEAPIRHIGHDYGYVRAEVMRILIVAAFLLVSLTITAVLRH